MSGVKGARRIGALCRPRKETVWRPTHLQRSAPACQMPPAGELAALSRPAQSLTAENVTNAMAASLRLSPYAACLHTVDLFRRHGAASARWLRLLRTFKFWWFQLRWGCRPLNQLRTGEALQYALSPCFNLLVTRSDLHFAASRGDFHIPSRKLFVPARHSMPSALLPSASVSELRNVNRYSRSSLFCKDRSGAGETGLSL